MGLEGVRVIERAGGSALEGGVNGCYFHDCNKV